MRFDLDAAVDRLCDDLDTLTMLGPQARRTIREHLGKAWRSGCASSLGEPSATTDPIGTRQPPTRRQAQVLDVIVEYTTRHGYPPCIREIGDRMGIVSTNGVSDHLRALERKGYIEREGLKSRTVRVIGWSKTVPPGPPT